MGRVSTDGVDGSGQRPISNVEDGGPRDQDIAASGIREIDPAAPLGSIGRYELLRELGRGSTGIVYEAYDPEARAVVALKTLVSMDAENVFRLKHEFRSLANLEHDTFVHLGELANTGDRLHFTMERVYGTDFLAYVRPRSPRPGAPSGAGAPTFDEDRLRHALAQLVEGLAALHEAGQIHRDVKPPNVLVTHEGRVVLLDFGMTRGFGTSEGFLGTPLYMAPEQISEGELTPATDWYAVGTMLYEALAGEHPFHGRTALVMQAKVLAEGAPSRAIPGPDNLRSLCVALLRREPEARPGIDEIRARLGLARPAGSMREVFVGRERELALLREALVGSRASTRSVVVCGEAGMGKSALAGRFLSELGNDAVVLRGRCYEQETVPFGGVDGLIDALSEYLLALPDDAVDRLVAGGVSNAARVFPVLRRVPLVDAQHSDGPVLNAANLRDLAFGEIVSMVAALGRSGTLVLFLDDLQWLDEGSLTLVRRLLQSTSTHHLFVATLRAGIAVSPDLAALVDGLQRIDVSRLSNDESRDMCRALETLEGDACEAVLREAGGHPLFLAELLRSARAGKLEQHASARLEEVLWERVSERDPVERRFLEMTALAGAPMPYTVVARAAGLDLGECSTRLARLRAAQLVRVSRVDDERCVEPYHDRVREAVMEHLRRPAGAPVEGLHLSLGRALLEATSESKLASRVFAIVQHLNLGRRRMESEHERRKLAELNLAASRQAFLTTAFERAREYARIGLEAAGPDGWSRHYALCRDLHLVLMEAEYVEGHREPARAVFVAAKARLKDPEEMASLYASWIAFEATSGHFQGALRAGREVLAQHGTRLPVRTTKVHVLAEYARARWAQRGRSAETLESLPIARDPSRQAVVRVLTALVAPAYFAEGDLVPWLMLRMARTSMETGMSEWSSTAIAGYGMVLSDAFGKRAEGAAFGRLAVALADRFENPCLQAEAHYLNGALLMPWVQTFRAAIESLRRAFHVASKHGGTKDQIYAGSLEVSLLFSESADLRETQERAEWQREFALQRQSNHIGSQSDFVARHAASLRGEAHGLDDPGLQRMPETDFVYRFTRADLAYLAGDVAGAERHLIAAQREPDVMFSHPRVVDVCLLEVLIGARRCDGARAFERARRIAEIVLRSRRLDSWAASCPANFEAHALLARAELSRVLGRDRAAAALYDRAAISARAHGSAKREGLACELAMRHARARGDRACEAAYCALAIAAYRSWGATVKVRTLEAEADDGVGEKKVDI
jgi:predicted ATPase